MSERRLLILSSTRKDGELSSMVLVGSGIECVVCEHAEQMKQEILKGAGVLMLVEEMLSRDLLAWLHEYVSGQPSWSDLPILVLSRQGANSPTILHSLEQLGNIQILERPVRVATLLSVVRSALKSRERQYTDREAQRQIRESQERFRVIAEESPFPMAIHAEDGQIIMVNHVWTDITGYTAEDIPTISSWTEKAYGEGRTAVQADIERLYGIAERIDEGEYVVRCKDGSARIWHFSSSPIGRLSDGRRAVISMAVDVTERKEAEESMRLAAAVYKDSSEAMMVTDENGTIITVNQAFREMTGYEATDVVGRNSRVLKSDQHDTAFYRSLWDEVRLTGRYKGEIWNRKKNGDIYAAQLTVNAVLGEDGDSPRYVSLMSDITEKKRSDDMIWMQANFDNLTGLPNRRFFRERLEHEVRNARRNNKPLALMFLDLDGFKDVNDTLGHDMGDLLLKEAAARLRHCVRETDMVARLGGDEFTLILTEVHEPDNVDRVARHILRVLSDPVRLGEDLAYVSGSIGITLFPSDALEVEDLIKNADQAMYAAKQEGKNQYHYFTPQMQDAALRRMHIINDLRGALDADQFEIVYQPIVDLSSGVIHKAEALIRWQHPTRGMISPTEFISAAEDTGMITAFGNWIFQEAARQAAKWREQYHPDFQISVNISPVQFKKEGIDPAIWLDHLKELGLPGQGIVVEITEGLLLDANPKVSDQLLMLRDAGIEVSLDDFGTGYSSLAYLQKFDIDYIKIDQAFVHDLTAESDNMALCEAIIVMAHKLGLQVIAEGVETRSQHKLLASGGCDFGQGYLFSRPVPADEFESLLAACPVHFPLKAAR